MLTEHAAEPEPEPGPKHSYSSHVEEGLELHDARLVEVGEEDDDDDDDDDP